MDVNKITLLDFAGILFLQNLNHRKKIEILHLYTRVRNLDYVVNKLTARCFARNVPSGEERGETDVFAGYAEAGT